VFQLVLLPNTSTYLPLHTQCQGKTISSLAHSFPASSFCYMGSGIQIISYFKNNAVDTI